VIVGKGEYGEILESQLFEVFQKQWILLDEEKWCRDIGKTEEEIRQRKRTMWFGFFLGFQEGITQGWNDHKERPDQWETMLKMDLGGKMPDDRDRVGVQP